MKYECPRPPLLVITPVPQTNEIGQSPIELFHANVFRAYACFEHSNLLKVTTPTPSPEQLSPGARPRQQGERRQCTPKRRTHAHRPKSNYELFNCNNLNIRYWSWNYRGCWHQTCPQLILVKGFRLYSFQLPDLKKPGIVIYCHYLPESGLGNLRACCLPWMW